jgi:hypothetical protein
MSRSEQCIVASSDQTQVNPDKTEDLSLYGILPGIAEGIWESGYDEWLLVGSVANTLFKSCPSGFPKPAASELASLGVRMK